MKVTVKKILTSTVLLLLLIKASLAQEHRFNLPLDKYCKTIISENFRSITPARKTILDDMAHELAHKKYILFTCKTNSRRTVLLQVWAQTAFYYYGVAGKNAFSMGDTITDVYPGAVKQLRKSGFYCIKQKNITPNQYVVSVSEQYPFNLLTSKDELGTIDTAKGLLVNICTNNEQSGIAALKGHVTLPFQSPAPYEKTPKEGQKYSVLNHQIAVEMLYLSKKVKEIMDSGF